MINAWRAVPTTAGSAGSEKDGGVGRRSRRPWRRAAAALAVTGVLALAAPALAADPMPKEVGPQPKSAMAIHGQTAVIEPGTTGQVRFGMVSFGGYPSVTKDWQMNMYAPEGTTFADATLTAVGGSPGPWHRCDLVQKDTFLVCYSDDPRSMALNTVQQWQVNIKVPADAPAGTRLNGGWAYFFTHSEPLPLIYWWHSPRMPMDARTA